MPKTRLFYGQDVRYAFRLLAKSPLSSLLTVVVLAGGLSVSIFTFSFLYTAMLKPLPVREGEGIVKLLSVTNGSWGAIDAADLAAVRRRLTSLTDLGAYSSRELVVGTGEGTRAIQATETEWNIFEVTRTLPALGRGFRREDQVAGAEPTVVLSDGVFRSVFGGDRDLIDRHVVLSGVSTRLIGVMPPGYGFPVASEAWVPIRPEILSATVPNQQAVEAYARLAPGSSRRRAAAELSALLLGVRRARPAEATAEERAEPTGMRVETFPIAQIGEVAPLLLAVLNTLATLILLLACVNVTNLLLARANERARETAVRLALGAPRPRLIMQCLWEIVLLCVAGGSLATGIAAAALGTLNDWAHAHLAGNLAFWWVWGFDRTLGFAAGAFVTLAVAVLGGVVAVRATRTEVNSILQEGGARSGDRREGRMARALVVTQVATVSVLMFVGCMSGVIAWRVVHVDLGFDTRNLLESSVELPAERYPDAPARGRFYQTLYEQLVARPELLGVVLREPLASISGEEGEFELREPGAASARARTFVQAVLGPLTPLGIDLRAGRFFDSRDRESSEPTVLVSRAFASRTWPNQSPIGRQIRLVGLEEKRWRTVVGVVDDAMLGNPLSRDRSTIAAYLPLRQTGAEEAMVLFRHRGSRPAGQSAFHQTLAGLDPLLTPAGVQSFEEVLAKTTMIARSVAGLFGICFGFALLLAASGTFGLMARSIGRRTREIGVRRALGASERNILRMLLGQGGRQLGIGALFALPLTVLAGFGFSHFFPVSFGLSVGVALLVAASVGAMVLAATWVPGRQAVAVEPRDALWRE
ncbi:MAG: ABC transporter permease [Acidobacteriota bacterium]